MQEESIEEAIRICIENIQNSNINIVDKVELLININHFLENYDEMIVREKYERYKNERLKTKNSKVFR